MAGDIGARMSAFESLSREEKAKRLSALTPEQRAAFVSSFQQWKGATPAAPEMPRASAEPAPTEPDWFAPKSTSGAILRGGAQGASMGFADELAGATNALGAAGVSALRRLGKSMPGRALVRQAYPQMASWPDNVIDAVIDKTTTEGQEQVYGSAGSPADVYRATRGAARTENATASAEHPKTYFASEIGGNLLVPTGIGAGAKVGGTGLKMLTKTGARTASGLLTGGATAAGNSEADLTNGEVGQFAGDVGKGAAVGAVASNVLGAGLDKGADWLKQRAAANAIKSAGVRGGISNQMQGMGYENAAQGRELGQVMLDEGVVPWFGRAEDVARRAGEAKDMRGALIEDALQQANHVKPDFDEMAWHAAKNVMDTGGIDDVAVGAGVKARKLVGSVLKTGQHPDADLMVANKMKSNMYDTINYSDSKLPASLQRAAARGVREGIESHVDRVAGSDVADQLRAANQRWGQLHDVEKLALDESQRQAGRTTSLTGSLGGVGVAAALGGPAGLGAGAVLPGVYSFLQPMSHGFMANAQRTAAPVFRSLAPTAGSRATQAYIEMVLRSDATPEEKRAALASALQRRE